MLQILSTWQTRPWVRACLFLRGSWRSQWNCWRRGTFVVNEGQHPKERGERIQFSSVQLLSHVPLFVTPWTAARQTSTACSNSCPLSQWCHPTISSSVIPFSSCPQSLPESFPMSQLFAWGGQSIGVSASASVLPMNIQDWFPLGLTGLISLLSKGLSRMQWNTLFSQVGGNPNQEAVKSPEGEKEFRQNWGFHLAL